jgi:enterochelin esterase-like enzyme
MEMARWRSIAGIAVIVTLGVNPVVVSAQVQTEVPPAVPGARPVKMERIRIHGASLAGNLEGNAVDREVLVYLPPGYATEPSRRYPVVYALHGYSIGAEQWSGEIHVPQTIEGAFAQGASEMIVVLPDSKTLHNGSMYSSSVTTGDFERFVSHDVVAYTTRTTARCPTAGAGAWWVIRWAGTAPRASA